MNIILVNEPSTLQLAGWTTAFIALGYLLRFILKFYQARTSVNGLPKPPHSFLFGHLVTIGKLMATLPPNLHPHRMLCLLIEQYKLPPIFYIDTFPFGWRLCLITDTEVAQQVTVQDSLPKHDSIGATIWPIAGYNSLISIQGKEHKKWRSVFNPGFAPAHLMTYVEGIVDDALVFTDVLSKFAESKKVFQLEEATTNVTVDIIGRVVLDVSMHAQTTDNPFVKAFRSSITWVRRSNDQNIFRMMNPARPFVFEYNKRVMNNFLDKVMEDRFATRQRGETTQSKGRARPAIDLAFDAYINDYATSESAKKLDPVFKKASMDHIKVFMFGGHDTSSSTICYVAYELYNNPDALRNVLQEYDDVFGTDVSQTSSKIKQDPYLLNRLPYTNAVIKEALRLYPPASSVRMGQPGYYLQHEGKQYPTEGFLVWPIACAIHISPKYWPEPLSFKPERWLVKESDPNYPIKGAWRAFEHGPRNCIGQELALIELKIIMALMLRTFKIIPAYDEWDLQNGNSKNAIKTTPDGNRGYQMLLATGKPADGMPVKVERRSSTPKTVEP